MENHFDIPNLRFDQKTGHPLGRQLERRKAQIPTI
jgi:hypothetical protein